MSYDQATLDAIAERDRNAPASSRVDSSIYGGSRNHGTKAWMHNHPLGVIAAFIAAAAGGSAAAGYGLTGTGGSLGGGAGGASSNMGIFSNGGQGGMSGVGGGNAGALANSGGISGGSGMGSATSAPASSNWQDLAKQGMQQQPQDNRQNRMATALRGGSADLERRRREEDDAETERRRRLAAAIQSEPMYSPA